MSVYPRHHKDFTRMHSNTVCFTVNKYLRQYLRTILLINLKTLFIRLLVDYCNNGKQLDAMMSFITVKLYRNMAGVVFRCLRFAASLQCAAERTNMCGSRKRLLESV